MAFNHANLWKRFRGISDGTARIHFFDLRELLWDNLSWLFSLLLGTKFAEVRGCDFQVFFLHFITFMSENVREKVDLIGQFMGIEILLFITKYRSEKFIIIDPNLKLFIFILCIYLFVNVSSCVCKLY